MRCGFSFPFLQMFTRWSSSHSHHSFHFFLLHEMHAVNTHIQGHLVFKAQWQIHHLLKNWNGNEQIMSISCRVLQATQRTMIYYCSLMNANGNIFGGNEFFLFSCLKYSVSPRKMWAMECSYNYHSIFPILWFTKMWWCKHNSIKVKSNSFCWKHISEMIRSSINNHG